MRKRVVIVFWLWLLLTLAGEFWARTTRFFPLSPVASAQGVVVDDAFRRLMMLAVPVSAFVVAMWGYSLLAFRGRHGPEEEGPPSEGNRWVGLSWIAVTGALTLVLIVDPGISGLNALTRLQSPTPSQEPLVVQVEAFQFGWNFTYPQYGIQSPGKLALPVDRLVRFEVTSKDVLHSFWIPDFRIKMDAVPGMVNVTYVTPTMVSSYAQNFNLRVQCAELCGAAHSVMTAPVEVVEPAAFTQWVAQQKKP